MVLLAVAVAAAAVVLLLAVAVLLLAVAGWHRQCRRWHQEEVRRCVRRRTLVAVSGVLVAAVANRVRQSLRKTKGCVCPVSVCPCCLVVVVVQFQ